MRALPPHQVRSALPGQVVRDDTVEVVAMLVDEGRELTIGLGFEGSYLVDHTFAVRRFDRLFSAIEALDELERGALGLTPARMAALAMLDELRVLLATGELAQARRLGGECVRDLEAAFPAIPRFTFRPIAGDGPGLGRIAEVALASLMCQHARGIAEVHEVVCLLADVLGGERAPHELRNLPLRATAFETTPNNIALLPLPLPVVHPASWSVVAERLGTSVAVARDRLMVSQGPLALAGELRDLLVRHIPLIPDREYPPLMLLPRDRFAGSAQADEPLGVRTIALTTHIRRYERLIDLAAPNHILADQARRVQSCVERVAEAAQMPIDYARLDGWGWTGHREDRVRLWYHRDPDDDTTSGKPPAIVWRTGDEIVLAIGDQAFAIAIADRRLRGEFPLGAVTLQTCDATGRYLLTTDYYANFGHDTTAGFGCYDTETDRWLDELPAHIPAVTFGVRDNDPSPWEDEPTAQLFEFRRMATFECSGEPAALAWARGNTAVLVSFARDKIAGVGLRSTETLYEHVSEQTLNARAHDCPVLLADGSFAAATNVHEEMAARWSDHPDDGYPAAVARFEDRWRFLLPSLHVVDSDRTHFRLGFPIDAAGFSPDGTRLAVFDGTLRIIDVATRSIVWQANVGAL